MVKLLPSAIIAYTRCVYKFVRACLYIVFVFAFLAHPIIANECSILPSYLLTLLHFTNPVKPRAPHSTCAQKSSAPAMMASLYIPRCALFVCFFFVRWLRAVRIRFFVLHSRRYIVCGAVASRVARSYLLLTVAYVAYARMYYI